MADTLESLLPKHLKRVEATLWRIGSLLDETKERSTALDLFDCQRPTSQGKYR